MTTLYLTLKKTVARGCLFFYCFRVVCGEIFSIFFFSGARFRYDSNRNFTEDRINVLSLVYANLILPPPPPLFSSGRLNTFDDLSGRFIILMSHRYRRSRVFHAARAMNFYSAPSRSLSFSRSSSRFLHTTTPNGTPKRMNARGITEMLYRRLLNRIWGSVKILRPMKDRHISHSSLFLFPSHKTYPSTPLASILYLPLRLVPRRVFRYSSNFLTRCFPQFPECTLFNDENDTLEDF